MSDMRSISLRVPRGMDDRLVQAAKRNHRSVNDQVNRYIERGLEADGIPALHPGGWAAKAQTFPQGDRSSEPDGRM